MEYVEVVDTCMYCRRAGVRELMWIHMVGSRRTRADERGSGR